MELSDEGTSEGLDSLFVGTCGSSVLAAEVVPSPVESAPRQDRDVIDHVKVGRLVRGMCEAKDLAGWRVAWGGLGDNSSLSEVFEALVCGLSAPGSPFHELEGLIAGSERSSNLAHELLPLPPAGVRAHLAEVLGHPPGDRRRTAGLWVKALAQVMNHLFCAGWTPTPICHACPSYLSAAQVDCLNRWLEYVSHFLQTSEACCALGPIRERMGDLRLGYSGQVAARALELQADKVTPAWPRREHTGLLSVVDFLDGELLGDLLSPARCLKPVEEWPTRVPRSEVKASDEEWFKIVSAGLKLGLMAKVEEDAIFRDQSGELILNGAMGVAKVKQLGDGSTVHLQRFITNLVPMNSYLRRLRGDSSLLPPVGRLGLIHLSDDEALELDSEDMESAFNLFRMPVAWRGAFAYSKPVPESACPGGDPHKRMYVAITTVPMGWVGAVDLIQHIARRLVFKIAKVPAGTEVQPKGLFPSEGPYSLVYMDGVDVVTRVRRESAERGKDGPGDPVGGGLTSKFRDACAALGLPLHAGKRIVRAAGGPILGAEIDGERGLLRHGRGKGHSLVFSILTLLGNSRWTVVPLQHCIGLYTFAAGFRRPLFAVFSAAYHEITAHDDLLPFTPSSPSVIELLVAALTVPLALTDLRAKIRPIISSSDASHQGGGASEASCFKPVMEPKVQALMERHAETSNEEAAFRSTESGHPCRVQGCSGVGLAPCPWRCGMHACSPVCYAVHIDQCHLRGLPCSTVAVYLDCVGVSSLGWALACQGVLTILTPNSKLTKRGFTKEGGCRDGVVHILARSPEIEVWVSLRPWFTYVQNVEVGRGGRLAHLGRGRALIRDLDKVLIGLMCRLKRALDNGCWWLVFLPLRGKLWGHASVCEILRLTNVFKSPLVRQNRQGDLLRVVALHNSAPLASELEESSSVVGCGSVELVPDFYLSRADQDRVVRVFVKHMEEMSGAQLPAGPSLWTPWLRGQLEGATARLQRQGVQDDVVPVISTLLRSMQCGHEAAHLEYLLRWADHRGSDVLLSSGTVLNGTTQRAPYPAFCWDWQSVQQYQWRAAQHINVLELTTLLNYLRMRTATGEVANMRIFHLFDSLVAASVAAKGRSSSFVLNRICRRTAAVCLSSSTFVVSLWTISSWQPSDSASRVAVRRDDG